MLDLPNMRAHVAWSDDTSRAAQSARYAAAPWLAFGHGLAGVCALASAPFAATFAWAPVWLGVAQLIVAYAYLGHRTAIFGKGKDGTLSPLSVLALLPHLFLVWGFFGLKLAGLRREPCYHRVAEGLVLGRRPFARELPADCELVVDLTAEFAADPLTLVGRRYRSLPVLNRHVPSDAEFTALIDELQRFRGGMYVHCGAGRGRSAMVVAALLVLRGAAADAREAERQLRAIRAGVRLHAGQRAIVDRCCAALSGRAAPDRARDAAAR